jgi:hypothetical protein
MASKKASRKRKGAKRALRPSWPDDLPNPDSLSTADILASIRPVAAELAAAPRSNELSRFVGACLASYVNREAKTLDQAFGLSRRGARPRNVLRDIEIATKVLRFQRSAAARERSASKAFFTDLCTEYVIKSRRNLERIAEKYREKAEWNLIAEGIYKKLNPAINSRI